jgi:hypothetical protein
MLQYGAALSVLTVHAEVTVTTMSEQAALAVRQDTAAWSPPSTLANMTVYLFT